MSAEFYQVCERLLSAAINGVYQGVAVALVVTMALRWIARTNAATRHAVWFAALLLVTALIPAHFLLLSRKHVGEVTVAPPTLGANRSAIEPVMTDAEIPVDAPLSDSHFANAPTGESQRAALDEFAGRPSGPSLPSDAAEEKFSLAAPNQTDNTPGSAIAKTPWWRLAWVNLKPWPWKSETAIGLPRWVCAGLILGWLTLATYRAGMIFGRIMEIRRAKKTSQIPPAALQTVFDSLCESLATRRNVRLRISAEHPTAAALGFLHPMVLLPTEMATDANEVEVEQVLRHELAHMQRRDDWANLAQQIIEAALFFHPAVWWIGSRLSLEREIACDDLVLERSGRPRGYALTLANAATRMSQRRHVLAPGVSNNNSQLQQRIAMILNTQRDRSSRLGKRWLGVFTTATATLAVAALLAGPRLVLGQTASVDLVAPTAPAPPAPPADVAAAAPAALPEPAEPPEPPEPAEIAEPASAPMVAVVTAPAPPSLPDDPAGAESGPRAKSVDEVSAPADGPPGPDAPPQPRAWKRGMSIEERLDRLERMLERLEERENMKGPHPRVEMAPPGNANWNDNGQYKLRGPNGAVLGLTMDQKTEVDRAARDAKRAAEESMRAAADGQRAAEEAMRDLEKLKGEDLAKLQNQLSQLPVKQLEALQNARNSLQQQLKSLDEEIKRLQAERRQMKKRGKDDSDSGDESDDSASVKP